MATISPHGHETAAAPDFRESTSYLFVGALRLCCVSIETLSSRGEGGIAMGLFRRLFGGPEAAAAMDALRLEVLMDYQVSWGLGSAALRWSDQYAIGSPLL